MELKMKPLNENDRVRFRCMRCAECCRHVFGAVIVEGLDVYRLSKYLKMSISDFISEFTDQFILDEVTAYPILSLKTRVVYVKDVPAGSSISYNRSFIAPRAMKVATLPLGYGDGYLRALSNKGEILIRGQRCRVLGNVTMDMLMVDIT